MTTHQNHFNTASITMQFLSCEIWLLWTLNSYMTSAFYAAIRISACNSCWIHISSWTGLGKIALQHMLKPGSTFLPECHFALSCLASSGFVLVSGNCEHIIVLKYIWISISLIAHISYSSRTLYKPITSNVAGRHKHIVYSGPYKTRPGKAMQGKTSRRVSHTIKDGCPLVFSCDQAALQMVFSVRPSVCLSVCLSHLFHHVPIIVSSWNCQELLPWSKSDVHAKGQGQRSKVKVTEVNTQLSRFWTLTPVWIHLWQWNHAHSWKQHRRGALLFFKVIRQISRSHGSKNRRIWPRLGVSGL